MTGSSRHLRRARVDDVDRLVELERELFGGDAWSAESLGSAVDTASGRVALVLDEDGELTSYGLVQVVGEVADLHRIAVTSSRQGGGRARTLLAALFVSAASNGAGRMLLEVSETNAAARRLYASAGFAELTRRRGYYRDGTDAVILECPLDGA